MIDSHSYTLPRKLAEKYPTGIARWAVPPLGCRREPLRDVTAPPRGHLQCPGRFGLPLGPGALSFRPHF